MKNIRNLLSKYKLLDDDVNYVNQYAGMLWLDPSFVEIKLLPKKKRTERELAIDLKKLILKCDARREDFDYTIYEEVTRLGLQTAKFIARKDNSWDDETYDYVEEDLPIVTARRL